MTQLFGIDLGLFDSRNFLIEEKFHQQFHHHCRQGMASFHKIYMWFQQNLQDVLFDLDFTNCSETFQVSRSEYEIALSQEWEGQFTWYSSDTSRPFMTMTSILFDLSGRVGGWMCWKVTGLTSDISVPSSYLVVYYIDVFQWPTG